MSPTLVANFTRGASWAAATPDANRRAAEKESAAAARRVSWVKRTPCWEAGMMNGSAVRPARVRLALGLGREQLAHQRELRRRAHVRRFDLLCLGIRLARQFRVDIAEVFVRSRIGRV